MSSQWIDTATLRIPLSKHWSTKEKHRFDMGKQSLLRLKPLFSGVFYKNLNVFVKIVG